MSRDEEMLSLIWKVRGSAKVTDEEEQSVDVRLLWEK